MSFSFEACIKREINSFMSYPSYTNRIYAGFIGDIKKVNLQRGLLSATEGGHTDMIKFFLSKGELDWASPAKIAIEKGDYNCLCTLFQFSRIWEVEEISKLLQTACKYDNVDIVDFLYIKNKIGHKSALNTAVRLNNVEVVKYLVGEMTKYKYLGGFDFDSLLFKASALPDSRIYNYIFSKRDAFY